MQAVEQTIYSQFANSPSLVTLIDAANQAIDPAQDIDSFYDLVFNVATAQGYGLDVWGRIVGVTRILTVTSGKFFGFDEASNVSADPFGQSPFYSGIAATSNYALSDDAFRTLIYAKALANITSGSVIGINAILMTLFAGRGNAWVTDPGNMTITYTFDFQLTAVEAAIVGQSGVLPRPSGVAATFKQA